MVAPTLSENTVLRSGEATVVVEYGEDGRARLDVRCDCYDHGSAEAGRLVCEAVHEARLRHAGGIACALDASGPACGAILEALHRRVGDDLESIATRRAGSTVMVVLQLQPLPTATPARGRRLPTGVPTQRDRRQWTGAETRPAH